jgi:hypothetical protein
MMATDYHPKDVSPLFTAMKDALSSAAIADPAAVKELALDLAEVAGVWTPGEWPSPPTRIPSERAVRAMVRLRRRFNSDAMPAAYGNDPDEVETMPFFFAGKTGRDGLPQPTEVGLWAYFLDLTADLKNFSSTGDEKNLSGSPGYFRRWLNGFCEECLRNKPGAAP